MQVKKVLLCCTGSVATIKLPLLIKYLKEKVESFSKDSGTDIELIIQVVMSKSAFNFCSTNQIPQDIKVYSDSDEWDLWNKRGDPVLHIELAKWADITVIAPLDANTLAKIATVSSKSCCISYL